MWAIQSNLSFAASPSTLFWIWLQISLSSNGSEMKPSWVLKCVCGRFRSSINLRVWPQSMGVTSNQWGSPGLGWQEIKQKLRSKRFKQSGLVTKVWSLRQNQIIRVTQRCSGDEGSHKSNQLVQRWWCTIKLALGLSFCFSLTKQVCSLSRFS